MQHNPLLIKYQWSRIIFLTDENLPFLDLKEIIFCEVFISNDFTVHNPVQIQFPNELCKKAVSSNFQISSMFGLQILSGDIKETLNGFGYCHGLHKEFPTGTSILNRLLGIYLSY